MQIQVRYFALLRDQRGQATETVETTAQTPRELYGELQARHGFTLPWEDVRAAVGLDFVEGEHPLREGVQVAFLPPVAGG